MKRHSGHLDQFIFRGLLGSYCVGELRTQGLLRTPAHSPQEVKDHDLLAAIPASIREGSVAMQRSYRLLYVFENLVRQFIDERFSEEDKTPDWWALRATQGMVKKYDDRKKEEEKNLWHTGRNQHPLFYVDFGDLGLLVTNHWTVFKDFFPNQAWVVSRIQETERTRNVIAHTNQLPAEEAERLERHLRDWLAQVG